MYRVRDVMTREVVSLREDDDLGLADEILAVGRIRHLPVTRGGLLVGLVTHRDLVAAARSSRRTPAHEVMQRGLRCIGPDDALQDAARTMLEFKIGCLPVVDEHRRLLGIVTEADLVRFALDIIQEFDEATDGLERFDDVEPLDAR